MMPSSMETIHYIVHMLIACLMAPSLPKTLQLNTTILETVQFGFTMQEQRHRRLLIRILPSTEVSKMFISMIKSLPSNIPSSFINLECNGPNFICQFSFVLSVCLFPQNKS